MSSVNTIKNCFVSFFIQIMLFNDEHVFLLRELDILEIILILIIHVSFRIDKIFDVIFRII
jgi:hypothetical protein